MVRMNWTINFHCAKGFRVNHYKVVELRWFTNRDICYNLAGRNDSIILHAIIKKRNRTGTQIRLGHAASYEEMCGLTTKI